MAGFKIDHIKIGDNEPPFVIAEMSGNHNKSLDNALRIVKAAKEAGANALKLQTYTAETITLNHYGGLFEITDENSLWYGRTLYELYEEAHTPWDWHKPIFDLARELGMVAFSSPFDESAVDFLETLNVPAYKIASFESGHFPLLKKVAKTGKPILISSGTSTLSELYESVAYLKQNGAKDIVIFKCTSTYPASASNSNLLTIPTFQSIFQDCVIGLSDHTKGIGVAVASVALGAKVVEKHFTLNRSEGGVDSDFSMEPGEFKLLTNEVKRAHKALGKVQLDTQKSEFKSRQFRRSIYVSKDIKEGELLNNENIKVVRPGDGLHPKYYELVLGKTASRDLKFGEPVTFSSVVL